MRVTRRVYWTIPVLAVVAIALIVVASNQDPWREPTILGWLGADAYYPRWILFIGDRTMMTVATLADGSIFAACLVIAWSFWKNRNHVIRFNHESMILYAALFLSVGLTHLVVTFTLFSGVYLLDLLVRSAAASLCAVTAGFTVRALLWPPRE